MELVSCLRHQSTKHHASELHIASGQSGGRVERRARFTANSEPCRATRHRPADNLRQGRSEPSQKSSGHLLCNGVALPLGSDAIDVSHSRAGDGQRC